MVLPVIIAGVAAAAESEAAIAAGVAATALLCAKRREVAEGVASIAEGAADLITTGARRLPYLFRDTPGPDGQNRAGNGSNDGTPSPGKPPPDGKGFLERMTFWNGVVSSAEILRRYITGDSNTDPVLYTLYRKSLGHYFGESVSLRTVLGVYQNISVGWVAGNLVFPGTMNFTSAVPYIALGQTIPVLHQVRSADVDLARIDYNSASALEAAYNVVTFGTLKWADLAIKGFGKIAFVGGARWALFETAFPRAAKAIRPDDLPSWRAVAIFAGGWLVWGGLTQVAISPVFEKSDIGQSVMQSSTRRAISMIAECPLMLGFNHNRPFFILADNLLFAATQWLTDSYYSAFDGQPLAVQQAIHAVTTAQTPSQLATILCAAPFTNHNIGLWSDAQISLAPKTWVALAETLSQSTLDDGALSSLSGVVERLVHAPDLGKRRVGMALGALLYQSALNYPDGLGPKGADARWRLAQELRQFHIVSTTDRALTAEELLVAVEDIDSGRYDGQFFNFPPLTSL